ncbi:MAG: metal-sulfur cluster assembly factor [Candidatus Helarchaeota archaeon]|nr:metal-sulfur cluster assembly factor [Candidatus Helarchaeota archaeon]
MVTKEEVMEALKEVVDPEIGVSLVEMDLIKDVLIEGDKVKVKMTLTIPGCPLANMIVDSVKRKVESLEGVEEAEVELVF